MEKEKALAINRNISICAGALCLFGGANLSLDAYGVYRKVTGTNFKLPEAFVFALLAGVPIGLCAYDMFCRTVTRPWDKEIEKRAAEKADISAVEKAKDIVDTVKEKTEEFKKDIEEMFADISPEKPEEEISTQQLTIEVGKAAKLLDRVKTRGGTQREIDGAEGFLDCLKAGISYKNILRELREKFDVDKLEEKYGNMD